MGLRSPLSHFWRVRILKPQAADASDCESPLASRSWRICFAKVFFGTRYGLYPNGVYVVKRTLSALTFPGARSINASVKHFLLGMFCSVLLCGCDKAPDPKSGVASAAWSSNEIPKELHEALFADAPTNRNSPEYHALTSRVSKSVSDYEAKQKW